MNVVGGMAVDAMCDMEDVHEIFDDSSAEASKTGNAAFEGTVHETSTSYDSDLLTYLAVRHLQSYNC